MILDYVIFGTAIIGSSVAAAYDLKTTEVPDWVFYAMMIIGIPAVIAKIFFGGSFGQFELSGITGLALFGFGYIMYRLGQWGGADMVILGLIGFLIPSANLEFANALSFPFGVSFILNLFIVGAIYMVLYAFVFALRNEEVIMKFKSGVKASSRMILIVSGSMAVAFTGIILYVNSLLGGALTSFDLARGIAIPLSLAIGFLFVFRFAKAVEEFGFKKKIPVSKLNVGDMLLDEKKLVGITGDQIRQIKKSGKKFVWIKEGVRFIPAFPAALLFTLLVGDAIMLIRIFF